MEITQELLHELFEYSDGELYWKKDRGRIKAGTLAGRVGSKGYRQIMINYKLYSNHRLIFLRHYGYLPKYIDHIDNNSLNNNIQNLRECTLIQNSRNAKRSIRNTSGHKGIDWNKKSKKWQVRLCLGNRRKSFGFYEDLELAVLVAEEARLKYHGEFANHGNKNEVNS